MKFKSFSIAATAAALLFASCGKEEASACRECSQSENQTIVNVVAQSGIRTKATGINDDATDTKKINSLQVFAFDSEGVLRSYENNTAGGSVSMKLNTGKEYTFYAVANNYGLTAWKYPGVAAISDVTALDAAPRVLRKIDSLKGCTILRTVHWTSDCSERGEAHALVTKDSSYAQVFRFVP